MTTLDEFTEDFTAEERAKVAARTAELIEEERTLLAEGRESGNFTGEGAESFRMRNSCSASSALLCALGGGVLLRGARAVPADERGAARDPHPPAQSGGPLPLPQAGEGIKAA